jgi:hypothetical protein
MVRAAGVREAGTDRPEPKLRLDNGRRGRESSAMTPKHIIAGIGIVLIIVGLVLPTGPNVYLIGAGAAVGNVAHFC